MVKRHWYTKKHGTQTAYYYEHPRNDDGKRELEPLGTDFAKAKEKWGQIEGIKVNTYELNTLGELYEKYMAWANKTQISNLTQRTIKDRTNYWTHIKPVFADIKVDEFKAEWLLHYFDKRSSQISAKKEIKFLSVLFNWGKLRGHCNIQNPVSGITRQLKVREHRDILITDDEYLAVHNVANGFIQDLMDLLYMAGCRPDEATNFKFTHDQGSELVYRMPKTKGIKRVQIGTDLRKLIDRRKKLLKENKVTLIDPPILFDDEGQPLVLTGNVRYWWKKARDKAKNTRRFQLKDIRPYAATKRYKQEGVEATRKFLGHSTEAQTRTYIRDYLGEETQSHELESIGLAKVNRRSGESS